MPRTFRRAYSNAKPGNAIILAENNGQLTGVIASWQFSTLTAAGDPGAGNVRFNHATAASVTEIYIDDLDGQDNDLGNWLSSAQEGAQLSFRSANAPAQFVIYEIASVTNSTGYRTIVVTHVDGTPTFLNGEALATAMSNAGPAGPTGADGKFSGTEVIKTAAYTALAADVGKTIILDKATVDTLSFEAAATLGSTWMVMVKNIGAGTWSLDPDASETIDGAATISLAQNESVVVSCNGTALRSLFRGSAAFTQFTAASSAGPAQMEFAEDTDNGTSKVVLKGQASLAGDIDVTLPASAGTLMVGATGSTDEAVLVADGTGGGTLKATPVIIDSATGNVSGVGTLGAGAVTATGLLTTNGQVKFPATANPSSDVNTLDEYEEGTFTPVLEGTTDVGSGTYSAQIGYYVKIGKVVTFLLEVVWSAHTGTGNMRFAGLPFANGGAQSVCGIEVSNMTYAAQLFALISASNTIVTPYTAATGGANTAVPMDTAATFRATGVYIAGT